MPRHGLNDRQIKPSGDCSVELPPAWEFFGLAAKGDSAAAEALLRTGDCSSPISVYNLFVLTPTPESYQEASAALEGDLRELLDVAAYTAGPTLRKKNSSPLRPN